MAPNEILVTKPLFSPCLSSFGFRNTFGIYSQVDKHAFKKYKIETIKYLSSESRNQLDWI